MTCSEEHRMKRMHPIAGLAGIAAPAVLCCALFVEAPKCAQEFHATAPGSVLMLPGVAVHLPSDRTKRIRGE